MSGKLAIHGGTKTITKTFLWPVFDHPELHAVEEVMRSGQWGNPNCTDRVAKFEEEFAAYQDAKYGVSCVNGSVALRIALIASGIKPGDEVIVPPYTFIATASIVAECNCVPIFVDISPETYNIDPAKIEEAITERTKAIVPVHFGGQSCDMDRIMKIAKTHNLFVLEDACHAHGGEYRGKKLGSIGHAGCFSFQSSKNLTSGEGGITITNNEKLRDTMDSLRNVGRVKGGEWYEHHYLGCNYRITQLQAAILLKQLERLEEQTQRRDANGRYLNELLSKIKGVSPLKRGHGETRHTYHVYIFKYDKAKFNNIPKKTFTQMLAAEGVPAFMGYPEPLYKQPVFQKKNFFCYTIPDHVDYTKVCCPEAEKACYEDAVWILQTALLGEREDMEAIAAAVKKIQDHAGEYKG